MSLFDERLRTIASMVPECNTVADIGCDHGHLLAELLASGRCRWGIAADINPQPLEKARKELERRNVSDRSECRCTDGLTGIAPVTLDCVVIAGMGGGLIADILSRFDYRENPSITYILQPMQRPVTVRRFLYEHGFTLKEERCCTVSGMFYTVMRAEYTGLATLSTPQALYFGAVDLVNDPLAPEMKQTVLSKAEKRLAGLVMAKPYEGRDAAISQMTHLLLALRKICQKAPKD